MLSRYAQHPPATSPLLFPTQELSTCSNSSSNKEHGEASALLSSALEALSSQSPSSLALTLRHFAAVHAAAEGVQTAAPTDSQPHSSQQTSSNGGNSGSGRDEGSGGASSSGGGGDEGSSLPLLTLRDVMRTEYCMAVRRVAQHDFLEGVRALLVDKDRDAKWRPRELGAVDAGELRHLMQVTGRW